MAVNRQEIKRMFAELSLGNPEAAVGFVLWRVMHRYQRAMDRALAPANLTHLQFTTLAMVAWLGLDHKPTQTEVACEAEMHPMQVSLMLKTLETKHLLRRVTSPRRANAKEVEVTAKGLAALRTAMPLALAVQRRMFGDERSPSGGDLLAHLRRVEESGEPENYHPA